MKGINGKHIWIIGASSGIGAALARELARQGAIIALSARREDKLNEVMSTLNGEGHIIAPLDAGDEQSIKAARDKILAVFPKIDSTLFMAAIFKPHDGVAPTPAFAREMLNINLGGAFNTLDATLPTYRAQKHGQLVLCASVAGYRGLPTGQPYCASKAAMINLAESLYLDLRPENIDVKVICPGFVKTPMTDKNDFPMPMMIQPEDAAKKIASALCKRAFEIHFPKRFTFIMKAVRLLPTPLYFWLAKTLAKEAEKRKT